MMNGSLKFLVVMLVLLVVNVLFNFMIVSLPENSLVYTFTWFIGAFSALAIVFFNQKRTEGDEDEF